MQMGSIPTLRNKDYAAAVTLTTSDHASCLEGLWHGCFMSGFSVVWHICCWQGEAKLQELQELSIESTLKAGAWGNQNGEHVLSCRIQPPITAYNQSTYSLWQILLLQALLGLFSPFHYPIWNDPGTSLLWQPKNPPNFYTFSVSIHMFLHH